MPATLALVTKAPVAIARQSPLLYLRDAATSPPFVAIAILATTLGFWIVGALGWAVALAVVVGGGMSSLRSTRVQRHLDRRATLRVRAHREDERMKTLRPAGPIRTHQYEGLRDLVEELERDHPNDALRYELQDLLSHFVRLSAMHQQCIDALRVAGP
ncbi:MAG TPA: hypothetical protein VGM39_09420, partial [Kofleriaceae bacterium]